MKVTCFLSVFCVATVFSASINSQNAKVTLSSNTFTIRQLISQIEKQTNYYFVYDSDNIDLNSEVNISNRKSTLENILNDALGNKNIAYKIEGGNIVLVKSTQSIQQSGSVVRGKVVDEKGNPVIGANVLQKGNSSNGTITNVNGEFSLRVPKGTALVVSYIGYNTQTIAVGGKVYMSVTLQENSKALDEVVVIGFGSVKKSDLTSSVSKITDDALKDRPLATVSEALQGQLSGVQAQATMGGTPGQELNIHIRGYNSITGSGNPLYVIDGVPRDNMSDINPSDIASIQILKDAAASSIYGARGGNGVVLIETKKGKGKPTITFDGYYGYQTPEKKLALMNGKEYVAYTMYTRNVQYLMAGGSMSDPMSSRPVAYQIPDNWSTFKNFVDWQDEVFRDAPMQNYQISASTKGDIGSIYFSTGYMDQQGIVKYTYYDKINARLNGQINVSKNLRAGVNMAASQSITDPRGSDASYGKETSIHHALMQSPLIQLNQATRDWGMPSDALVGGAVYPNPVEQLKYTKDKTTMNRISAILWGEYDIISGLTFRSQYSNNYDGRVYEYFQPGNVTYSNGNVTKGSSLTSSNWDWTFQNTLTFDRAYKKHHLNVVLGQTAEKQRYFQANLGATGWPYETISTMNQATTPTTASTQRLSYTTASFFGRMTYDYNDKYLFTATLRRDGSSRFGANNRWGTFPSFSAGWKINQEAFMKDIDWISLLKIRASWGKAGNDNIGNYVYSAALTSDNTSWNGALVSGIATANISNPDLKWEATRSIDLGLDFSAFQNRIQFSFDYYNNKTTDLLYDMPTPTTTGFSSYTTNIGAIRNTGIEIDITSHNLTGSFKWDTELNVSHNSNKVLSLGGLNNLTLNEAGLPQYITTVGKPISRFTCWRTNGFLTAADFDSNGNALVPIQAGQMEGNFKFVDQPDAKGNKDGVINANDYVPYGTNFPDVTYGLTNHFSYKNFDLSILMQGQIGGKICYIGARHVDCGAWGRNTFGRWIHCYKPDWVAKYGRGNPIPTAYNTANGIDMSWDGKSPNPFGQFTMNNDSRIYSTTYLRIKNITFSYTLPKSLLSKTLLSSARLYISLDNVRIFDNYPGYTPESNRYGGANMVEQGLDYNTYALSRRYTFGVNLVF